MLAHSLAWILTVAGDYWLGQCLSEAGEEIKSVLNECRITKRLLAIGDTSPLFPCCTSAEETGKLLFASYHMSKILNSTLEELKHYIMGISCNRIHNNKQPGLHWVYLAYADSTRGLTGPWYWCRQESFCWDQTLCDMQSWATVYFANFIYRMGKTQSSQIVHHLSYRPVLCLGCPPPA